MNTVHLTIMGQVQGVGFRAFVKKQAKNLGLCGWVQNCNDGSVEVYAEGDGEKLLLLKTACEKGPVGAKVDRVIENEVSLQSMQHFEIRY